MKAKDYAETTTMVAEHCLNERTEESLNRFVDALNSTMKSLMQESEQLSVKRHIKLDSGMHAILLEQHNKWSAICRIHNKKVPNLPLLLPLFMFYVWRTPLKTILIKYGLPKGVMLEDLQQLEEQEATAKCSGGE